MRSHALVTTIIGLLQFATASKTCGGAGNNLQRCFASSSVLAKAYCSSYLSFPIVTVATTPSAITILLTIVSTEVDVSTITTSSTATSDVTATTVMTTFTTIKTIAPTADPNLPVKKRNGSGGLALSSGFACVTSSTTKNSAILYSPSSISAACLCLAITPSTMTVAARTRTQTSYTPQTTTTSTTTVQVVTTVVLTLTQINQETDIPTSTITSSISSTLSSSIAAPTVFACDQNSAQDFAICCLTQPVSDPNSPGFYMGTECTADTPFSLDYADTCSANYPYALCCHKLSFNNDGTVLSGTDCSIPT